MYEFISALFWCIFIVMEIIAVNCDCILKFPKNISASPSYNKILGRRSLKVSYMEDGLHLKVNERISGYCATKFNDFHYTHQEDYYPKRIGDNNGLITKERTVQLYCQNDRLYYSNGFPIYENTLSCAEIKWSLYESPYNFSWCQDGIGSYILGTKSLPENSFLAALCYDMDKMMLQSIHYTVGPKSLTDDHNKPIILPPAKMKNTGFGTEIEHFNSIFNYYSKEELNNELKNNSKTRYWLKLSNYEYESLVQAGPYAKYFQNYGLVVDIIWWPNLRKGNWHRFLMALDRRAAMVNYKMFVGASGSIRVPLTDECLEYGRGELMLGINNRTIPAYVWAYLQTATETEEVVIIGYNTPFFEFFPEKDTIFCKDICDQISWLVDVRPTFRFATFGILFCCNPADIRSTGYLDGFPRTEVLLGVETATVKSFY